MLTRLIYFSEQSRPGDRALLDAVLKTARSRNAQMDVTGLLISEGPHFVQVLEGHRNAVSAIYTSIASDDRHRNPVLVDVSSVVERLFEDWPMADFHDPAFIAEACSGISGGNPVFEPYDMDGAVLLLLVKRVHAMLAGDRSGRQSAAPPVRRASP